MTTQADVNYVDDAQRRVAADTLCFQKKAEIVIPTSGQAQLDTDVIKIEGMFSGKTQVEHASADDLLAWLSGSQQTASGQQHACLIGRTLYVFPRPIEALTLTLVYKARPPVWESDDPLTLTGQWESLIDQLTQATLLLDQGQTNAAAAALNDYQTQMARLRRRAGAKPGGSGRLRRLGARIR